MHLGSTSDLSPGTHQTGSLWQGLYSKLLGLCNLRRAREQESSLETAGIIVVTALSPGSFLIPSWGVSWSQGWCSCHMDPFQTKIQPARFRASVVSDLAFNQESVAGSVIQASRAVEFEDGVMMKVLPLGCWYPCGNCIQPRINSKSLLECKPPKGCGLVQKTMQLSCMDHL